MQGARVATCGDVGSNSEKASLERDVQLGGDVVKLRFERGRVPGVRFDQRS